MSGIKTPVESIGRQVWSSKRQVAVCLRSADAFAIASALNLHDEMVRALEQAAEDYIDLIGHEDQYGTYGRAEAARAACLRIKDLLARAKGAKR